MRRFENRDVTKMYLTPDGIEMYNGYTYHQKTYGEWVTDFSARNMLVRSNPDVIAKIESWIESANFVSQKSPNYSIDSTAIKHIAEKEIGPISDGDFIYCMNKLFVVFWKDSRDKHCFFNIKLNSIKRIVQDQILGIRKINYETDHIVLL